MEHPNISTASSGIGDMLQLLGENKKYLLRFGSRATQEKLDPVLDKMEE